MKQPQIFKLFATAIVIYLLPSSLFGQIPDSLKFDWHRAGLDSTFTMPTNTINLLTFGAVPDDGLPDDAALQSALANLGPNGAIIQIPPGTFNFTASINIPSNCILQGAGADSTTFSFNFNNAVANCINFWGSTGSSWFPIIGNLNKGAYGLLVANSTITSFNAGDRIEIRQQNGAWDTNPATWASGSVGHVSTIDSIVGDTLFMREPLRIDFDSSLSPEIRKLNCVENSGLECVKIIRADSSAASVNYAIYAYFAFNCRVRGVESFKSIGAHFLAEASAHLEVSGCYFHEAYGYTGSNTRGYGAVLGVHSNLCKVENNIFRKLRHSMMVKQGANGNVFAYNYSLEPNRSEFPSNYGADICIHGHFPFANLFEGNVCQNIIVDQAWGPNGPHNAYFRNRAELYGFIISSGTVQSDKQTIVGNEIISTAFFQGQYTLNGINHFQMANRVQGNITPAGTNQLSESSLFLNAPPAYWGSLPWPSIGVPFTSTTQSVPAAIRYANSGSKTICGDPDTLFSSTQGSITESPLIAYFANGGLYVKQPNSPFTEPISLYDMNGRCIIKLNEPSSTRFPIYLDIPPGVYVLRYGLDGQSLQRKLVRLTY
ncbi:MAG: glycosyl hydrolase family 28-related protein [Bacteroidota bacterium]